LPHINAFLFKSKSGSDDHSPATPKADTARSNTAVARAPSALATKSSSTGAGASKPSLSSAASLKKTASVAGGHAPVSA